MHYIWCQRSLTENDLHFVLSDLPSLYKLTCLHAVHDIINLYVSLYFTRINKTIFNHSVDTLPVLHYWPFQGWGEKLAWTAAFRLQAGQLWLLFPFTMKLHLRWMAVEGISNPKGWPFHPHKPWTGQTFKICHYWWANTATISILLNLL